MKDYSNRIHLSLVILILSILCLARSSNAAAGSGPYSRAEENAPMALSLQQAVELGLAADEELEKARKQIEGAKAQVTEATSAAYPKLTLSGQYGRNLKKPVLFLPPEFSQGFGMTSSYVEIGEDNDFYGQANITMPLWTVGRVGAAINIARDLVNTYSRQEEAVKDYAEFRVKEAYYSVLLSAEMLDIAEKALAATEESARVARAGHEEGTVSRFDLMRAEVELANRQSPLVQAENDLQQSMILLRRRCGLEPDTPITLTDSLRAAERPVELDTLISRMRRSSPELKALEAQMSMRKHTLKYRKAERYPMFNLSAYYALQSQWSDDFYPDEDMIAKTAAVQIGVQIPIFDGFSAKGKIRKAQADLRIAEIELDKATRNKELAVRTAWLSLKNALAALRGRREAVDLAEEAHRIAVIRLRNGLATPLERLDAELAMTTARGQLAQALFLFSVARAQLEMAAGTEEIYGQ